MDAKRAARAAIWARTVIPKMSREQQDELGILFARYEPAQVQAAVERYDAEIAHEGFLNLSTLRHFLNGPPAMESPDDRRARIAAEIAEKRRLDSEAFAKVERERASIVAALEALSPDRLEELRQRVLAICDRFLAARLSERPALGPSASHVLQGAIYAELQREQEAECQVA